jgi:hypothetical protein
MSESHADNGYLWGGRAIGREIDRSPRQTYHLIEHGHLRCVKKLGGVYVAHRNELRREMSALVQRETEPTS